MVRCNLITSWPGWFCGVALTSISLPSAAALIDENFNDVTGLSGAGSTRSIQDTLSGNPSQLPPGTLWFALNAGDVNVRRADNPINTGAVALGFDSFFSPADSGNKFLVLGDRDGPINGPPNGGLFAFAVPFTVPAGATHINVSFDWAFDGVDTNNGAQDRFVAGILGDGFIINNPTAIVSPLVNQTGPSFAAGHVDSTLAVGSLPTPIPILGTRYLVFGLSESLAINTNSAAGIDNIMVSAVPVPAAVWLFGSALMGMGVIGRRKAVA